MYVPRKTLRPTFKGYLFAGIFDFSQKGTGAKGFAMATTGVILFLLGAKFEDHCSSILLFNWNYLWRQHSPHLHNTDRKIKNYFK